VRLPKTKELVSTVPEPHIEKIGTTLIWKRKLFMTDSKPIIAPPSMSQKL